jgi:hypothetical protein
MHKRQVYTENANESFPQPSRMSLDESRGIRKLSLRVRKGSTPVILRDRLVRTFATATPREP